MIRLPIQDRVEAGRLLGEQLSKLAASDPIVLALPRGGVPVGFEVARALDADLDVMVVRKVGVPWQPELAIGAVAGDVKFVDERFAAEIGLSQAQIDRAVEDAKVELRRREALYHRAHPALDLNDRTVVLVDDGLATGSTMLAAARLARAAQPKKLIIAVPVGSVEACERLRREADEFVCLATPDPFSAVGEWYVDFRQVTDAEVRSLLESHKEALHQRVTGGR